MDINLKFENKDKDLINQEIKNKLIEFTVIKKIEEEEIEKKINIIFIFNEIIKTHICEKKEKVPKPRIYFDHKLADEESVEKHRFQSNCLESPFYVINGCNEYDCPKPPYKKDIVEEYLTSEQIQDKFKSFEYASEEDIKKCRNCGEKRINNFLHMLSSPRRKRSKSPRRKRSKSPSKKKE